MPTKQTDETDSIDAEGNLQRKANAMGLAKAIGRQRDAYAKNLDDSGKVKAMVAGFGKPEVTNHANKSYQKFADGGFVGGFAEGLSSQLDDDKERRSKRAGIPDQTKSGFSRVKDFFTGNAKDDEDGQETG